MAEMLTVESALYAWFGFYLSSFDREARLAAGRKLNAVLTSPDDYDDDIYSCACRARENDLENTRKDPGFVYFVEGGGFAKIGKTQRPNKRLTQITLLMPFKVRPLLFIATYDMTLVERRLHKALADYRANGEWFELPYDNYVSIVLGSPGVISGEQIDDLLADNGKAVLDHMLQVR